MKEQFIKISEVCENYEVVRGKLLKLRDDGIIREKKHEGSYILLYLEDVNKHLVKRELIK